MRLDQQPVYAVPKPIKEKKPKFGKKAKPRKKTKRIKKENKIPGMNMRKKFSADVIERALEFWDYRCGNCRVARPDDPHHIRRKTDNGKGVFTNCLPVCRPCHIEIEANAELRQSWKEWAKKQWGFHYWEDVYDLYFAGLIKETTEEEYQKFMCKEREKCLQDGSASNHI